MEATIPPQQPISRAIKHLDHGTQGTVVMQLARGLWMPRSTPKRSQASADQPVRQRLGQLRVVP
jgi:hypothetical protein